MAKQPYLAKRKGSENLYYREAVPADVRKLLESRGAVAPVEITLSLGTPDPRLANERLVDVRAKHYREWARLRASAPANDGYRGSRAKSGIAASGLVPAVECHLSPATAFGQCVSAPRATGFGRKRPRAL